MHIRSLALEVIVKSVSYETPAIKAWEFQIPGGGDLPCFEAGAHIDVHLADGLTRSYSLLNSQTERHRYVVAVHRDPAGRGGSVFMHDRLHAGQRVRISMPRNNFRLIEEAPYSVLVAGGVGITPILSMLRRLTAIGRPWELHYCARTHADAAFVDDLAAFNSPQGQVFLNCDCEPGGALLDIASVVARAPQGAHLYCCGPVRMLASFEQACVARPREKVHVEHFSSQSEPATGGGFCVMLARSRKEIFVPGGKSILQALLDAGVDAPYSCGEGLCGSCEVPVLEGVPDHRDVVLTAAERESNRKIMICFSGCKTERLVLDL